MVDGTKLTKCPHHVARDDLLLVVLLPPSFPNLLNLLGQEKLLNLVEDTPLGQLEILLLLGLVRRRMRSPHGHLRRIHLLPMQGL